MLAFERLARLALRLGIGAAGTQKDVVAEDINSRKRTLCS
jgi:hypothetical protein